MQDDILTIEAGRAEAHYWKDLWRYRELFYFLAWRDILVRYKQTTIGVAWSILRPLVTMLIFTIVFGHLAKLPSDGVPYPILVFSAMLPWQFFANSLSETSSSLIGNANMISKVYFPRVIIPASVVIVSLVDFVISGAIMIFIMLAYQFAPSWTFLMLPFFVLILLAFSLGAGLWLSALNVKYRDFRYIVPFLVQMGVYVSPVGFTSNIVPHAWRPLYSLNPMVGIIDGFRWAISGGQGNIYIPGFLVSILVAMFIFITGLHYFRTTERSFADTI